MAIAYIRFSSISRSGGRSTVAASMYRSGEKGTSMYDGVEHDYSRKTGIVYTDVFLPENALEEFKDRLTLWNSLETHVSSPKARLARECVVALPRELSTEQQIELIQRYVQETFTPLGMCADVAIHHPRNDNTSGDIEISNPHAHIMLTCFPLDENGQWQAKSIAEYVCRRGDEERLLTSAEYKELKAEGWEKQYRYKDPISGRNTWMTPSEAAALSLAPLDRVFKGARVTHGGRRSNIIKSWDSPQRIKEFREAWEKCANEALEKAGSTERIDMRSYTDQGRVGELGMLHEGPRARHMDDRNRQHGDAERSDRHFINAQIREHNEHVREERAIETAIDAKVHSTAEQLQSIRVEAAAASAVEAATSIASIAEDASRYRLNEFEIAERELRAIQEINSAAIKTIETLLSTVHVVGDIVYKGSHALAQISEERKKIDVRERYAQRVMERVGCNSIEDLQSEIRNLRQTLNDAKVNDNASTALPLSTVYNLIEEYKQILNTVPSNLHEQLASEIEQLDFDGEVLEKIDSEALSEALQRVDDELAALSEGAVSETHLSLCR